MNPSRILRFLLLPFACLAGQFDVVFIDVWKNGRKARIMAWSWPRAAG